MFTIWWDWSSSRSNVILRAPPHSDELERSGPFSHFLQPLVIFQRADESGDRIEPAIQILKGATARLYGQTPAPFGGCSRRENDRHERGIAYHPSGTRVNPRPAQDKPEPFRKARSEYPKNLKKMNAIKFF